jgi:ABC-type phosphate transport system substrate-binding protein
MNHLKPRLIAAVAFLLACLFISRLSEAADVVVVVNPSVTVRKLPGGTLRAIFGMRLLKWNDGKPIRVFVLDDNQPVHVAFCKEVLDLFPYQLRQSWDRLVFSGTGQAPIQVASEEEILASVAATPGAVGYLRRSMVDDRVNILSTK